MSQSDAVLTREGSVARDAGRFRLRFHPLLLVLLAQALVSGRLAWVNSAFGDEAHYLYDGRLELHGWMTGNPVPAVHMSGAPQIYPPLGAAADALGGLPVARLLSLAFMLGATGLLYAAACRLFGRTAALWAAALGTFNEPVLRLGFATFDALSVLLLMAAFYLVVRSAAARLSGELVAAAGVCLLLSALVAVSFAIYIPVVAAVMLCVWAERRGWDNAIVPVVWQFVLIGALAVIGVSRLHVAKDFFGTTLNPQRGLGASVSGIAGEAAGWAVPVVVLALAGAVLAFVTFGWRSPHGWLVAVLAFAGVVVPAYQAYLAKDYSMDKHMAPGAELAAVAVGYAVSRVWTALAGHVRLGRLRGVAVFAASVVVLALPLAYGASTAYTTFRQWPDTTALTAALRAPLETGPVTGSLLVDTAGPANFNPAIFSYYLPDTDVRATSDPGAAADVAAGRYPAAVQDLNSAALESAAAPDGGLTPALRHAVLTAAERDKTGAELAASRRYAITAALPYVTSSDADPAGVFVIWSLKP